MRRIIGGVGIAACLAGLVVLSACTPDLFAYALSGFDSSTDAPPQKTQVTVASFTQEISAPGLRPSIVDGSTDVAEAEPAPAVTAPAAQIQLGAYRDEANAASDWNRVQSQTNGLLSGLAPAIAPVDLPGKGRLYRLRVSVSDTGAATALCAGLKSRGFDCIHVRD